MDLRACYQTFRLKESVGRRLRGAVLRGGEREQEEERERRKVEALAEQVGAAPVSLRLL